MLKNISAWEDRVEIIAENAIPATGNKSRALRLRKDMLMCRLSLARLAGLEPDPPTDGWSEA